ncbi:MAG TPA: dual specificity protein phosphatase family protein [Nitrospirota bacterium]|nr:dual specificity protein phosphatase family protein [Nitrospirota bacterium]
MSDYRLTWISDSLATGAAPLSYDDLETIRNQGISVIVNLCAEFCDLQDIEQAGGFEVYYLPIADESAPDIEELEKALAWLDEALYLGKKALVHCRHGIGRTGTFVAAYLLRKGFGLKRAEAALKKVRTAPSSFPQWRLLRNYFKNEGELTLIEPTLDSDPVVDLNPFFADYERIVEEPAKLQAPPGERCGIDHDTCCHAPLPLSLIEAAYLNYRINRGLTLAQRKESIYRALAQTARNAGAYLCPLSVEGRCVAASFRPLACRLTAVQMEDDARERSRLDELSRQVFLALHASFAPETMPRFMLADVVSGKFVQSYFDLISGNGKQQG